MLNRPLLEYRLRNLREHGVQGIVLACSKGMRGVEERFGDGSSLGVRISYCYEERPLGSGRAVKEAARAAGTSGPLVVCNGDILTNIDLTSMLEQHRLAAATLSISLARVDDPWHYGVVEVDEDQRIRRFVEKPPEGEEPSNLINAGTWIFEPEVLARIPDDDTAIIDGFCERVLFPGIIEAGLRVQGFVEDLWVDIGSPERYLRANRLMLERVAHQIGEDALVCEGAELADDVVISGLVCVGAGARVGPGTRIVGPVVIGERTALGAHVRLSTSVLWEAAAIGNGASITGSIIGGGVAVGAGAKICDAVIADRASIPGGRAIASGARIMPDEQVA